MLGEPLSVGSFFLFIKTVSYCGENHLQQVLPVQILFIPKLARAPLRCSQDRVFRTLRSATKGVAFGNHKLLKKFDKTLMGFVLQ